MISFADMEKKERKKQMSDLISRQVAIDAISSMFAPTPVQKDMVEDCLEVIENLPSAEPKTGECKYCTYWEKLNYEAPRQGWCNRFKDWTDADEYCSRCVRRRRK